MRIVFPSIQHPNDYGYVFDGGAGWRYKSRYTSHMVHDTFGFYQTFGDGLTAHSPDVALTVEFYADYLLSLARHLLSVESREERGKLLRELSFSFSSKADNEQIGFAYLLRPNEKKDTWYSLETQVRRGGQYRYPVTTDREKQYDNRYHRVEAWMDGTFGAVVRLLQKEHHSIHDRYMLAHQVAEWFRGTPNQWVAGNVYIKRDAEETLLELPVPCKADFGELDPYEWGLNAIVALLVAEQKMNEAEANVENWTSRLQRAADAPAEEVAS